MSINYKKAEREEQEKTSYAKFDIQTIGAGILFLVNNPDHLVNLRPFINHEDFFASDNNLQPRALRQVIKTINESVRDRGPGVITEKYVSAALDQTAEGEEFAAARQFFALMRSDPTYRERSRDPGCHLIFLDFLKANATRRWSEKFSVAWSKGDMTGATKRMKELTSEIDSIRLDSVADSIDIGEMSNEELMTFLSVNVEKNGDIFRLGHDKLDEDIGGFERRALHLFCGSTNSGKSMMSQHLISRSIEQKMYVHIAVVEDRPKSFLRRLIANISGIEMNRLKNQQNTSFTSDEMRSITSAKALINHYVKIDYAYGESLDTIHRRKLDYDAERSAKGQKPYDVDIVDYSGHIADKSQGDKAYEKYRNAFASRKNFALVYNKVAFDFAQLNREGHKKKEAKLQASHGDLAGAYDLSQVCDNIIVLHRAVNDFENNDVTLLVTKVKDGALIQGGYKVGAEFARARWNMTKHDGTAVTAAEQTLPVNNNGFDGSGT